MNTSLPASDDYAALFLSSTPLLDVRAPVEFQRGAFPNTTNLPLLDNDQRAAVGKRYKEAGQEAAIELGWSFATPQLSAQRIDAWSSYLRRHPQAQLYCFRGGLRSQLSQQLLAEAGWHIPRIAGGYKALRQFLLQSLEQHCQAGRLLVLAGPTGSGKTQWLKQFANALDLEHWAAHRGSAFGATSQAQPSQIDFEHRISVALLEGLHRHPWLVIEDEGRLLGLLSLPPCLTSALAHSPVLQLECDLGERARRIVEDYVLEPLALQGQIQGDPDKVRLNLQQGLGRIRKRLGGLRFMQYQSQLDTAFAALLKCSDSSAMQVLVAGLLRDYYDPMYDYQWQGQARPVLYRGTGPALKHWLAQRARLPLSCLIKAGLEK